MRFKTKAVVNHVQAHLELGCEEFFRGEVHTRGRPHGLAGNEFRIGPTAALHEPFLVMFCKREGVVISLYDALWWTDQLAKPDPLVERDGTRPSCERSLELNLGSTNARTLSPATDEPEMHSVRRRVLVDAFSRQHNDVVGLQETYKRNSIIRVCGGFHMITSAAVSGQGGGGDLG